MFWTMTDVTRFPHLRMKICEVVVVSARLCKITYHLRTAYRENITRSGEIVEIVVSCFILICCVTSSSSQNWRIIMTRGTTFNYIACATKSDIRAIEDCILILLNVISPANITNNMSWIKWYCSINHYNIFPLLSLLVSCLTFLVHQTKQSSLRNKSYTIINLVWNSYSMMSKSNNEIYLGIFEAKFSGLTW